MASDTTSTTLSNSHTNQCWQKLNNLPEDEEQAADLVDDLAWEFHIEATKDTEYYSQDNFDFLLKILSDKDLCAQEHISEFLQNIRLGKRSLSDEHIIKLVECIVKNYNIYADNMLEILALEFICDHNSPQTTLKLFEKIEENNKTSKLTSMWFKTKDILESEDQTTELWEQARQLYNKIQARKVPEKENEDSSLGIEGLGVKECWQKLQILPPKNIGKYIENLSSNLFNGQLLGVTNFSDENFGFFLKLYQNKNLCSQRGMVSFMALLRFVE
ncbi:hypothetical protein [Kiloniella sp.]|uniref:hypothetical protein n=1 Tax=Kiloniella sp. TaxID=1938587 RepID=UPI003B0158B9